MQIKHELVTFSKRKRMCSSQEDPDWHFGGYSTVTTRL